MDGRMGRNARQMGRVGLITTGYHRMLQDTFINMFSLVVTFVMCYRSHHATEVTALQKS